MNATSQMVPVLSGRRLNALLAAGIRLIVGCGVVFRIFDPSQLRFLPRCPFLVLTGFYCPGCGALRALHQLLMGNVGNALAFNPFAVLATPFLVYGGVSFLSFRVRGRYLPRIFVPARWIWGLCAAIVLFGVLRNIPVYPLNMLAPGAAIGMQ